MRRRGPLAAAAPSTIVALGVAAAVRAVGTVLVAEAIARGVADMANQVDPGPILMLGLIGAILRATGTWAGTTIGARAGADLTAGLRNKLGARALRPGAPDGVVLLGAHRLDELEVYCTTVLPALVSAAVIPIIVGARILLADWVSAVVIVVTIPFVPLFMALVGLHTRDRVEAASAALERLSGHLLELAAGLPVLVGLSRALEQAAVLRRISEEYRKRTMATLRVVFLSSLVLELVATISVAVIAVAVGLRLLTGDLPLWAGLLALVLAPECYGALRDVGAAFHAGDAGLAAHDRARRILDSPETSVPTYVGPAALDGLIVRYLGRGAALAGLDLVPKPDSITALVGRSGSGKSTALRALAGLLDGSDALITGTITIPPDGTAYLPQHPVPTSETVMGEMRLYGSGLADATLERLLERVGLTSFADDDPRQLSPGELRRLGIARVLARVEAGARLVLLDEPTAHLDGGDRAIVEQLIVELASTTTVVVATHEQSTVALAGTVIRFDGRSTDDPASVSSADAVPAAHRPSTGDPAHEAPSKGTLTGLGEVLRPVAWRFAFGGVLGVGAALAAASLTAVSGWLIVRAGAQPDIAFLLVAIVGVRFFGIARAVLRYLERLTTHDAVLRAVTILRDRLWSGLAAHGAASRKLFSGATALDLLVVTIDQVRDLIPRVLVPPAVAATTAIAAAVTAVVLEPAALPVLLIGLLAAFVVAPSLALVADRAAGPAGVLLRARIARDFSSAVAAADDLRANGVAGAALAAIGLLDDETRRQSKRRAFARGLGSGLAVLACCWTAVTEIAVAAEAQTPAAVAGVLALLPLALIEPAMAGVAGVQQLPSLAAAWGRIREVLRPVPEGGSELLDTEVDDLVLERLGARWSTSSPPVFEDLDATVERGEWLVVTGPSGSGKSTLLTVLLGALPAASGRYLFGSADTRLLSRSEISRAVAWSPQDAHVFDSTVRANLLLADGEADRDTMLAVLERVGLGPLIRSAEDGLNLRVGAGGRSLSGGERGRLAVARMLLCNAAVVLLDEPTAHLDRSTASALMTDLRSTLGDRVVVLVSHRGEDRLPADRLVTLTRRATVMPGTGP